MSKFTFYNIYIKTIIKQDTRVLEVNLHSTIFILKQDNATNTDESTSTFTFYNIYIKTVADKIDLHKDKDIYILQYLY